MEETAPRNPAELHTSVMLERCVELLTPGAERDGAFVVDATLGMGGHTEALLERFPNLTVIGLDRDTEALELAGARLARSAAVRTRARRVRRDRQGT